MPNAQDLRCTGPSTPSRRAVLGGLGSAAAAAGLTACSSASGDHGALSFWNFYGPDPAGTPASEWFERTVAEWNREHKRQISLRFIPNSTYTSGQTLQTAFSADAGPDIFLVSPGDFLRYYNGGALLDLTPYLSEAARTDYPDNVIATREVDGKIYALPMEVEPLGMYYSKAAFERAGIEDPPKTWDQLLETAERLTTGNRFGLLLETLPGYYQNFVWYPFLWQGDGEAVRSSRSVFDSAAATAALDLWRQTQQRRLSPRSALGTGTNDAPSNLASGYVAMQQTGIWAVSDLRTKTPRFRYGVFPLPTPPGGRARTAAGGWAFAVNARGKDPEQAARFVAWALASTDRQGIERQLKWNTEAKTNVPPRTSVQRLADRRKLFAKGALRTFTDTIAPTARPEPRYPPEVYKAISDAIQATQMSGKDPRGAAATAGSVIENFLTTYDGAAIL